MGNCESRPCLYERVPHLQQWKCEFDALMVMDKDLEAMYEVFCEIDEDGSGDIDLAEMIRVLELKRTKFNKRIFTLFDEDGSGEIDFREFVIALWNYCTMGKAALTLFAFDLYDTDGSGAMELCEMEQMLKECYGKSYKNSDNAKRVMKKIEDMTENSDCEAVNIREFAEFCDFHPGLLFPAFKFQIDLCQKIVGVKFWQRAAKTRLKLTNGKNMSVQELLDGTVQPSRAQRGGDAEQYPETKGGHQAEPNSVAQDIARLNSGTLAARRKAKGLSQGQKNKIRSIGKFQRIARSKTLHQRRDNRDKYSPARRSSKPGNRVSPK